MRFARSAGVLLHPTSLPGRYGIGDFGQSAYQFVDFLVSSKQSLWQVLPLGPTGYADSPYQSFSAFAGNPLLISPDLMVKEGFLPVSALDFVPPFPKEKVDFGWVIDYKNKLFAQAHDYFQENATPKQQATFADFCTTQQAWLDDYAMFMAFKQVHVDDDGGIWHTWPEEIAFRDPAGLATWSNKYANDIEHYKLLQFIFFEQWTALKTYANEQGIQIVGDVPIFVAYDSADVWANPALFYLDDQGAPTVIAGVPPDYFSETGQRWGNPLYRWDKMAEDNYAWWAERLRMTFRQVDIVRIDHFRGFEAYWEIPASEPTAVVGQWVPGPDKALFQALQDQLGELPIIAEDLGVITPGVEALRDAFDFPGMKVLQFGFGGEQNNAFLPHNFTTTNCVVYTGTHDNDTTHGWYRTATSKEQDFIRRYIARDGHDIAWDMIRLAYGSIADVAIASMQDLLNLSGEARMNLPGTKSGNWQWRYTTSMLNDFISYRLGDLTTIYGRIPALDEEE